VRRKLHSRTKVREVIRKAYWLEFENESILNYLAKYYLLAGSCKPVVSGNIRLQDTLRTEPEFVIEVLETPSN